MALFLVFEVEDEDANSNSMFPVPALSWEGLRAESMVSETLTIRGESTQMGCMDPAIRVGVGFAFL